jgi:hypothetical protein
MAWVEARFGVPVEVSRKTGIPDYLSWDGRPRFRAPPPHPTPRTVVRYRGARLKNTGLLTGDAGLARFVGAACAYSLCKRGEHVTLKGGRHVAIMNVCEVGRLDERNCSRGVRRVRPGSTAL